MSQFQMLKKFLQFGELDSNLSRKFRPL